VRGFTLAAGCRVRDADLSMLVLGSHPKGPGLRPAARWPFGLLLLATLFVGQTALTAPPVVRADGGEMFLPVEGLDFLNVPLNSVSAPMTEHITNTSAAPLRDIQIDQRIPSPFVTGGDASTCTQPDLVLYPGDSCWIEVRFAPSSVGAANDAIFVSACSGVCTSSSGERSSFGGFAVNGYGTTFTRATLLSDPSVISFHRVDIAGSGATSAISLELFTDPNNPALVAQLYTVRFSDRTSFAVSDDTCGGLLKTFVFVPCQIEISFTPHEIRDYHERMIIDPFGEFPLTGAGAVTGPTFSGDGDVGSVRVGTSATRAVVVTNPGPNSLQFDAQAPLSVAGSTEFSTQRSTCTGAVAPSSQCIVTLRFSPRQREVVSARLTFNDDAVVQQQTVTVTAHGVAPLVSLSPADTVDFGTVLVGSTPTLTSGRGTVHLTNSGDFPLTFQAAVSGSGYSLSGLSTCGLTLDPGATCLLVVDLSPLSSGPVRGEVHIDDDATGTPHVVRLFAQATAGPIVRFEPSSASFGHVRANDVGADRTVTMSNVGNQDLTYTASISGDAYALAGGTCAPQGTLQPGNACTFLTHFQPTDGNEHFGALILDDNAIGTPQQALLDGFGEAPFTGCLSLALRPHLTMLNSPYTVTCNLFVDPGKSATIDPGVELRMSDDVEFHVSGTLNVDGADEGAGHVLITSRTRDSGSVWNGITFHAGAQTKISQLTVENIRGGQALAFDSVVQATLDHVTVQHVQGNGLHYVVAGATESFSNGTLSDISQAGIVFSGSSCARVTDTRISFTKDYGVVIGGLGCDPDLSGLVQNSTGPRGDNHIRQHGFYFGGTRTIHHRGYAYDVETLPITSGGSLSLEPGVALFMDPDAVASFSSATLTALGTAGQPIRMTSASGDDQSRWGGLLLNSASRASLAYVTLEYIRAEQAIGLGAVSQAQMDHLIVRHVQGNGLHYAGGGSAETFSNGVLDDVTGRGIWFSDPGCAQVTGTKISNAGDYGVLIGNLGCDPDLAGLELLSTGPHGNNHIRQDTFYFGGTRTVRNRGYDYDINGSLPITTGQLTVEPGVVLHLPTDATVSIGTGSLTMLGTPGAPILVTSMTGDAGSHWGGMVLNDGSSSTLTNVTLEYVQGDQGVGFGAVQQARLDHVHVRHVVGNGLRYGPHGSAETFTSSTLDDLSGRGIWFSGPACAQVADTRINRTGDYGVVIGDLSCDPDLSGLSLINTGPAGQNHIRQETFYFGGTRTLHNRGYDYDLNGTTAITTGSLTLEAGVVVHLETDATVSVGTGSLTALGTAGAPIRLTSSTGDAATHWGGVALFDGAHVAMRGVQIDHASGDAALTVHNLAPGSKLEFLTVRDNAAIGVVVNGSITPNLSNGNIFGNSTSRRAPAGLWNVGTGIVTATNVFWGDPTGPFHPLLNPSGLGNAVGDNVVFEPWAGETVLLPLTLVPPPELTVATDRGLATATLDPGVATTTGIGLRGARSDGLALNAPYPLGLTRITWSALDAAGRSVSGVESIVVQDRESPVLAIPADVVVVAAPGAYKATLDPGRATATDNVPGVVVEARRSDGVAPTSAFRAGVTAITWTATDTSGNTATAVQHVTVQLDSHTQVIALDPTSGATLQLPLGHGQIVFPPNLVGVPSLVVLTDRPAPPQPLGAGQLFANRAYTLTVLDAATEAPISQFRTSYTASISYADADLQNAGIGSSATLALASFTGSAWQPEAGGQLDLANHLVVTSLTHASDWALIGSIDLTGCTDCIGPPPGPGATPELDSLLLFATGGAGLLGYAGAVRRRLCKTRSGPGEDQRKAID
jgi:hypothetical protein